MTMVMAAAWSASVAPPSAVAGDVASAAAAGSQYSGFGAIATGGHGRPVFKVSSLADRGSGTLRDALALASGAGGATVTFGVGGDIVLGSGLSVPANTTIDGTSAPAPGVTLWGDGVGGGGGVLNIYKSNVIVRGLRIRNAGNDGVQIAPKAGVSISGIVIDHCSVTNSGDGGIDVTGRNGLTTTDVTLSWNYIAGSGSGCAKGTCGGGSLIKYGVDRVSVHANLWDKNLRRNPSVNGGQIVDGTLADIRGNVVRGYQQSGVQVVNGARANVVGNFIDGGKPAWFASPYVYAAQNVMDGPEGTQAASWDVMAPLGAVTRDAVVGGAGASPRDDLDHFYMDVLKTYAEVKSAGVDAGEPPVGGGSPGPSAAPTPSVKPTPAPPSAGDYPLAAFPANLIDEAGIYQARALYKRADGERRRARFPMAETDYIVLMRMLQGATGHFARESHRIMARTEHDLAGMDRWRFKRIPAALQHARASIAHCAIGGCDARTMGSVGQAVEIAAYLVNHGQAVPAWDPPRY
jgi:hypothetical protein